MSAAVHAIAVVVPVHDEEALLGRCLAALEAAVRESPVPCEVRIVLDACSDGSADVAAQHPFPVVRIGANAVGAARARGAEAALAALQAGGFGDRDRIWIAHTDADSVVPADWLSVQHAFALSGADVVLGTVRPDFADLTPRHRAHWLRTHTRGRPAGNTHGANLGIRASTYLAAGGFSNLPLDEDVRLVEACRAIGASVLASDAAEVLTSGRSVGRAPGGYAAFVRDTARSFADEGGLELISEGEHV